MAHSPAGIERLSSPLAMLMSTNNSMPTSPNHISQTKEGIPLSIFESDCGVQRSSSGQLATARGQDTNNLGSMQVALAKVNRY